MPYPVDVSHLADKIETPTLDLMGDLDTQARPDMSGCKSVLEDRKASRSPMLSTMRRIFGIGGSYQTTTVARLRHL